MKKYIYKENEYRTERALRVAIFEAERLALPMLSTVDDWAKYGVTLTVTEPVVTESSLDTMKGQKLGQIGALFEQFRKSSKTYIESTLGFRANANTTAFENVSGLIAQLQYRQEQGEYEPVVNYMSFDNTVFDLSLSQLKTLQMEISLYGSSAYEYKWMKKAQVRACNSKEELDAIKFDTEEIGH